MTVTAWQLDTLQLTPERSSVAYELKVEVDAQHCTYAAAHFPRSELLATITDAGAIIESNAEHGFRFADLSTDSTLVFWVWVTFQEDTDPVKWLRRFQHVLGRKLNERVATEDWEKLLVCYNFPHAWQARMDTTLVADTRYHRLFVG